MSVTLFTPAQSKKSDKNPCQPDPEKLKELEVLAGKTHRAFKALQKAQAKLDKAIKEHGPKSPEAQAARKLLKHATQEFERLYQELQKKRDETLYPCGKDPNPETPKQSNPEPQPKTTAQEKSTQDGKKTEKKPEAQPPAATEKQKGESPSYDHYLKPLNTEELKKKIGKDKDPKKLLDELQKQPHGEMLLRPYSLFRKRPAVPMPVEPKLPATPKPDPKDPTAP